MPDAKWRTYEELAKFIIQELAEEFDIGEVEGKQVIPGESGTNWEIDAKGIKVGDSGVVLIECRRYLTSRIKQEQMAAIAYRIKDIGAVSGITVSPLEPQEGAKILAAHENITHVVLDPESTTESYFASFFNKAFVKTTETLCIGDVYQLEILQNGKRIE